MLKQCASPAEADTEEPTSRSTVGLLAVVAGLDDKQQDRDQSPTEPEAEPTETSQPCDTIPEAAAAAAPAMTTATSPPPPPPETEQPGQQQHHAADEGDAEQPEATATATATATPSEELGGRLVCAVCDGVLPTEAALAVHLQSHAAGDPAGDQVQGFACRVCRRVFDDADVLDRHVLTHPGEQVFKCPLCGQGLRTNGGLARHAHRHLEGLDGHADLLRQESLARAAKRRHAEEQDHDVEVKRRSPAPSQEDVSPSPVTAAATTPVAPCFTCPVCPPSQPFRAQYLPELEAHLEQNHRDYSVSCELCGGSYRSVRDLNLHLHTAHRSGGKSGRTRDIFGFKDLTFVDFSSLKFAQIAVHECEKNLHRAQRQHPFQCECGLAFPCDSALVIHRQACPNTVYVDTATDLPHGQLGAARRSGGLLEVPQGSARAVSPKGDFFAKLDLLNNATPLVNGSVPNGLHNGASTPYVDRDLADIQSILSVSASSGMVLPEHDDHGDHEEQQDAFAAEFRRMKQRGEFPCRLCPEVFPNLRALKGHNRAHMATPGADGYRCNMCPHAALDKVALQRHMRTHNGARPFECALCRFAFTTKANCERHLRNRHSKCSRDEVKSSIIYHPSEDPGNDPDQHTVKRSLFAEAGAEDATLRRHSLDVATMTSASEDEERDERGASEQGADDQLDDQDDPGRQSPLDLSKKRPPSPPADEDLDQDEVQADEEEEEDEQPQDLSRKPVPKESSSAAVTPTSHPLLHNNHAAPGPLQSPEAAATAAGAGAALPFPLYVNPYQGLAPGLASGLAPGLGATLGATPNGLPGALPFSYYPGLLRSLQLGQLGPVGGLVMEPMRLLQRPPFLSTAASPAESPVSSLAVPPEADCIVACPAASPKSERSSASESHLQQQSSVSSGGSSSSKMVMKNGVLMPKQKQRRYRTERPHVCEHCSARFTLSSNRERHVKHQHPQFWSQRHRGPGGGGPGGLHHTGPGTPPSGSGPQPVDASTPLRAPSDTPSKHEEDDEDEGLVIDEERPSSEDHHGDDDGTEGDAEDEFHPKVDKEKPTEDLASVSRLLDNASIQSFRQFLRDGRDGEDPVTLPSALPHPATPCSAPSREAREAREEPLSLASEEDMDEEGLVAGSPSEGNNSGSEQDKSDEPENAAPPKKKSAYSLAPNRVCCPYCSRKFPWTSSLRRHVLTHTGQKPYKCSFCPLLFTTKSNCDRHLARKHSNKKDAANSSSSSSSGVSSGTPNSSAASVSPGSSASGGSPPDVLSTRPAALSPQGPQGVPAGLPQGILRPFKCRHCPTSTFASLTSLRKHVVGKHSGASVESCVMPGEDLRDLRGYESHSSVSDVEVCDAEDKKVDIKIPVFGLAHDAQQPLSLCKVDRLDADMRDVSLEPRDPRLDVSKEEPLALRRSSESDIMKEAHSSLMSSSPALPISAPVVSIPEGTALPSESSVTLSSSELPFKCHLCDGSFTDRQECLDHIRINHASEYEILLSKGALELNVATSPEDNHHAMEENHQVEGENIEHIRGKFPDYANRKVMCAFCMRRFWSAEDLRRHMRTHTGERPFSCDVCRRRFTLKHSMLRHRKKHNDNNNSISVPLVNSNGPEDLSSSAASGDGEGFLAPLKLSPQLIMHHMNMTNHNNNNINMAGVNKTFIAAICEKLSSKRNSARRKDEEDSGLIGNLLGIGDPSIIDKVLLTKSADDAEKLLGVHKNGNKSSNGRT